MTKKDGAQINRRISNICERVFRSANIGGKASVFLGGRDYCFSCNIKLGAVPSLLGQSVCDRPVHGGGMLSFPHVLIKTRIILKKKKLSKKINYPT